MPNICSPCGSTESTATGTPTGKPSPCNVPLQPMTIARTNHYAAPPDCTTLDRTRVALGLLLNFGHPATRRWGPHHKLESRPNPPLNGFSNGLLMLAFPRFLRRRSSAEHATRVRAQIKLAPQART